MFNLSLLNSNGLARDGLAYGALTDFRDWSFVDGEPAPESRRRKKRQNRRIQESVSCALKKVHVNQINMHEQCF